MRRIMTELLYVDEQLSQRNLFIRAAVNSALFEKDQVAAIEPSNCIKETIEKILEYEIKVLIVDYRLDDHAPDVQFNGVQLVKTFQERFDKFPCFVTTAFAREAAQDNYDINLVFSKSEFLDTENDPLPELPFFQRVRGKISEYEKMIDRMQKRIIKLQEQMNQKKLSSSEAQELLDLDDQLEKTLGAEYCIEAHIKQKALEPLNKLLAKTNDLIRRIEDELSENVGNK